nr:MAG TPA: hypothetical protein [Caudoviricetes sp.]
MVSAPHESCTTNCYLQDKSNRVLFVYTTSYVSKQIEDCIDNLSKILYLYKGSLNELLNSRHWDYSCLHGDMSL